MNNILDKLVDNGSVSSYELIEGEPDLTDREVDTLILTFPNGQKLSLATFCSGSSGKTCLIIEDE